MKANPDTKIIASGTTRDGKTAFLHEDGTVSNRLTTFGFTSLSPEIMHKFFGRIDAVHSGDVAKAIKAANKGRMPNYLAGADAREASLRLARVEKARIEIMYDRTIPRRK